MTEWTLAAANDAVAAAVGDRDMVVWGADRRTYAEVGDRSRRLAGHLVARGLGLHRERAGLERWECGQSPVALIMANRPEYLEAMYASFRARAVPFNVNHQYRPHEIRALLEAIGAEAVIYQRQLAAVVGEAVDGLDLVLIDIDDGSGAEPVAGAVDYERAVEAGGPASLPEPQGDDLYMVCTGGTTGAPKGVLWRQADIFHAAMGGPEAATAEALGTTAVANTEGRWFAAPPLMHAAAQWTAFAGLHTGATVVLHDDTQRFDAGAILRVAEAERISLISVVGDAYARPLVEELRRRSYDLSSLGTIGIGGAVTSEEHKLALLELIPHVMIVDGYGASETGGMAFGARTTASKAAGFAPGAGAVVLSADRRRLLDPGDDEVGWTARRGRVPLGYLGDPEATATTFPVIDGERFAVPGDRATLGEDGTITVLGRDSMVVNTGGEKVFVEEVEEVLRGHAAVADALVVGRPCDRFGQEVVGVVQLRPGATATAAELREFCAGSLARFKAPRAIAYVDTIGRHPSGKPDYRWARDAAASAEQV